MSAPASIVGVTSSPRLIPYMSVDMFATDRRSGVNTDNLVPRGRPASQEAALAEYIEEASVWIDDFCQQILAATVDTVLDRVNIGRDGFAVIHPRYRPVIALTAFAIGATPAQLTAYDSLAGSGVRLDSFAVPVGLGGFGGIPINSNQGPLQFGRGAVSYQDQAWCQYSYQNGFPVTSLTEPATAGATSIEVADTTGIVPGLTWLTIYGGAKRTRGLVQAVSTADAGGVGTGPGTITFTAPIPYDVPNREDYPTFVSDLPSSVISACAAVVRGLIKDTGGDSSKSSASTDSAGSGSGDDYDTAAACLRAYVAPIE